MAILQVPRSLTLVAVAVLLAGCVGKKAAAPIIGTAKIDRRTIVVDATATGAIEPITVVEVKSKASGMIIKMPVETGTIVKQGDLLVQIDTRDVKNQYDQALADVNTAKANLDVTTAAKKRADELYKTRVITTPEFEAASLALTTSQASIVRANTNLDLAKQRLEDATVVAPSNGTIIDRPVSVGMVIQSATGGSASGGTTLLKMADLSRVQVRVLVNETDIGSIRSGQDARVVVDAYPDRPFVGVVEKVEPQAVVVQSVTMFPVIVSLDNSEGFLKPGMNGETSVLIDQRTNVVAVPNDAIRSVREAATAALLVGLNPDTVQAMVKAQQAALAAARGGNGGGPGVGTPSDAPATQAVAATGGADKGAAANAGGAGARRGGMGAGGDSTRRGGNRGGMGAGGDSTRRLGNRGGMGGDSTRRNRGGMGGDSTRRFGNRGGAGGRGDSGGNSGSGSGAAGGRQRGQGGTGGNLAMGGNNRGGQGGVGGGGRGFGGQAGGRGGMNGGGSKSRSRSGLVFVQIPNSFEPRIVQLGASNYDYSEVISGLKEGEVVATLAVAALQAKRDAANDRMRQTQGGVPGMQRNANGTTAIPGGGGPGGGGGGGPRGGGGGRQ